MKVQHRMYIIGVVSNVAFHGDNSDGKTIYMKELWNGAVVKGKNLEARGGIEPPLEVLQTSALPLGDRASLQARCGQHVKCYRELSFCATAQKSFAATVSLRVRSLPG